MNRAGFGKIHKSWAKPSGHEAPRHRRLTAGHPLQETAMTTPLTITSLSQGALHKPPQSEDAYWQRYNVQPELEDLPFWHAIKIEWPRWSLRQRADQT
jgi:hypothetical protein